MKLTGRKVSSAVALFLVLSMVQLAAPWCLAASAQEGSITAKLSTSGDGSVVVNGISTSPDATVISGSTIDTPAGVSAIITIEPLGSLALAPESSLKLEYQAGSIHASVVKGCATLNTKKGTTGTLEGVNGVPINTDPAADSRISTCSNDGTAAAGATAGAAPGSVGIPYRLGVTLGFIGSAGAVIFSIVNPTNNARGNNPSPATPNG